MPKTYLRTTYQFNELSKKAKEKALDKLRDLGNEFFDTDHITEMFANHLSEQNYPNDDIRWSLSCCQGDGVAFYGKLSTEQLVAAVKRCFQKESPVDFTNVFIKLIEDQTISVEITSRSRHYHHYNSMDVEIEYNDEVSEGMSALGSKLVAFIEDDIQTISKEMEKLGYQEIDYMQSEAVLSEEAIESEREFNEDGTLASLKGCV